MIGRKRIKREYHRDVLGCLALISLAQQVHFSLDEIALLSANQRILIIDRDCSLFVRHYLKSA
ncbi:hypothetical protein OSB94_10470 [Proteus vulgaris]|uniref:hypothetical protein n=1 Tax=Proteus TaxID=583 RepID=UPI0013A53E14|nr:MULTISPECIES: hypothetical protein [Proteus]MBQ0212916.1 hypothetical protein [Proteus vulgaris]MDS0788516.1 hypothetical protein [Proteus vulgaris]